MREGNKIAPYYDSTVENSSFSLLKIERCPVEVTSMKKKISGEKNAIWSIKSNIERSDALSSMRNRMCCLVHQSGLRKICQSSLVCFRRIIGWIIFYTLVSSFRLWRMIVRESGTSRSMWVSSTSDQPGLKKNPWRSRRTSTNEREANLSGCKKQSGKNFALRSSTTSTKHTRLARCCNDYRRVIGSNKTCCQSLLVAMSIFTPTETLAVPSVAPILSPTKSPVNNMLTTQQIGNSTTPSPSVLFDASPLPTSNATKSPSSESPIGTPTISPTRAPTKSPTASPIDIPTTPFPTHIPSAAPTPSPTGMPTPSPTNKPSKPPTISPTPDPTTQPTISQAPSPSPTSIPSSVPSARPTPSPTASPSATPTFQPTHSPTNYPTSSPTFSELSEVNQRFLQTYEGKELEQMTPEQKVYMQNTYASYTPLYGKNGGEGEPGRVTTRCTLIAQTFSTSEDNNFLEVDFVMNYTSPKTNVSQLDYPADFYKYMNSETGKNRTLINLESVGVKAEVLNDLRIKVVTPTSPPTPPPTASATNTPTNAPTVYPTFMPTGKDQIPPSASPTGKKPSSGFPTIAPSISPSTPISPRGGTPIAVIASVSAVGAATIILAIIFCYIRPRRQQSKAKKRRSSPTQRDTPLKDDDKRANLRIDIEEAVPVNEVSHHSGEISNDEYDSDEPPVPESLLSRESLLSYGHSMSSDSVIEKDETNVLADEFDQYKNPDLEKMRTEVEGNVVNSDGMMSQALTRALMMDDDDSTRDVNELNWGGARDAMEIEASVLCETNDWLKKKEGASLDEKRSFMQDALNKMVASVRHNIIAPEEASRTIHGCAAMLGLQLADNIPETALIVTGMRKTVQRENVIQAFKEFGEIEDAAVAPRSRGFGLVRFISPKFVQRALDKFKKEEIVVQDVAVMVRVLSSPSQDVSLPPVQDVVRPLPDMDKNRQFARGTPSTAAAAAGRPPSRDERTGMAAHHSSNLDSLGYVDDSLGGRNVGRVSRSRATGSDSGASVESRRSSRSRHSSRDPSAASSTADGASRRRRHRSVGTGKFAS